MTADFHCYERFRLESQPFAEHDASNVQCECVAGARGQCDVDGHGVVVLDGSTAASSGCMRAICAVALTTASVLSLNVRRQKT